MEFTKPKGTLDLRVTKRGYPYPGMTTFDERHPRYLGLDRLWLKPSEYAAYFPRELKAGATTTVTGPARDRFVLHCHMMKGQVPWDESMFQNMEMTSKVIKADNRQIELQIQASYQLKGNNQWNRSTYKGKLLAKAVYNRQSESFDEFETVILGDSTAGSRQSNVHAGDLTSTIASYLTINPLKDADDALPPHNWMYGYGLQWCRSQ